LTEEKLTEEITKTLKDLTVAGDTILGDVVISGGLNVGTLNINTDNSINAAGVLKLQPLALDGIEFLGGLVRFDTEGNIVARTVEVETIKVRGASAGTAVVKAGEAGLLVETERVGEDTLVFITPTSKTTGTLSVGEIIAGGELSSRAYRGGRRRRLV